MCIPIFILKTHQLSFNIKYLLSETEEWGKEGLPVYKQLYNSFKELIISQRIPNYTKLPSTRVLAKDLELSRSTVVKVFDLLCFEQLLFSKKGSGYYVQYSTEINTLNTEKPKNYRYPKISKRAKLFQKYKSLNTDDFSKNNIAFRPGLPPLDIFPVHKWKQLSNEYWRGSTPTNLSYAPSQGLKALQVSIMNYLRVYRNLDCSYHQIIITSGSLHSLYLIGNALINKNDDIVMENPTFPRAYNLFKSIKANVIPCGIDNEGMRINTIQKINPKFIYTTPSNQYPLGIKMTKDRRLEVLEWISKKQSLVIEDDYDHEFSNWDKPIQSLFSLDKEKRVIYLGTFNKLLHPSLRIGYMVVPYYLVAPIKAIYEQSTRFVPLHTQETLSNFIQKNYLNNHIRTVIKTATHRKQLFTTQTQNVFEVDNHFEGLHIIGKLKNNVNDYKFHKKLLEKNVVAYPLSNYYFTKEKQEGMVLGYASVNEKIMKEKTAVIENIFLRY